MVAVCGKLVVRPLSTKLLRKVSSLIVTRVSLLPPPCSCKIIKGSAEAGPEPIWVQDGLTPTYPDSLAIGMPGNVLVPGRYTITIEGINAAGDQQGEKVQDITFEATLAE